MTVEWFDEELGERFLLEDDDNTLYCPYTNGSTCAVAANGWQVQELCEALECEQLRLLPRAKRRRHKAA